MARRDALLRMHKMLLARKAEIRRKLEEELDALRAKGVDITGDSADAAFEAGSDEMTSQLAELDARELAQIDRALLRLKQGTYGLCEVCQGKIPLGRLNALPYSTLCIECQREMERYPNWHAGRGDHAAWEKVFDAVRPLEEQREVTLSDLEMNLRDH
jgi:DnaK suppressor protein